MKNKKININLSGAVLREVNLREVSLDDSNLNVSDLSGADLRGLKINSDLESTDLSKAILSSADLTGAKLIETKFKGAFYNSKTKGLSDEQKKQMTDVDPRLHDAVTILSLEKLKELVNSFGANILYLNSNDDSILIHAVHRHDVEMVKYILNQPSVTKEYVNVKNKQGRGAMICALSFNINKAPNQTIVNMLLGKGADPQ